MKHKFIATLAIIALGSFGHASLPVNEFRVGKNQTAAEVFRNLAEADTGENDFQVLVTPEIAERELTGLVLRNIAFDRSIQIICEKNKLSYIQKGKLFVITGSPESIAAVRKEMYGVESPPQRKLNYAYERKEISNMPVIGERPEFEMVWEMRKELEALRNRVATLENDGAIQAQVATP